MRFAVLGHLVVQADQGGQVSVPGAKERLLLALLAAGAPGVVSVDRLLDQLWDGAPPATARKSLQAHVVRLRSALEPDRPKGSTGRYVVRRGAGYALAVARDALDALHFGDLAARGRAQVASGDPAAAVRELGAALAMWRGEPYADWPDAPFAVAESRRLTEVRASAVAGLMEAQLALGRHADVVPELERLVGEDPLREGWWSLLMLALYRDGRQADALAAGRRVRALLAEELGADPGPGLRAVETGILTQDPTLDLPSAPPRDLPKQRTGSGAERGPAELRDAPSAGQDSCPYKGLAAYQVEDAHLFHGRRRLVAALVGRLVDASLLVVSGPSGAGKSSLLRAGRVPALAQGALPGSGAWQPVIVTPGRRPVDALAALTGESPPVAPVLLVCDQLEELWAPGSDAAERAAFLDAVLGLVDDGVVVRCVAAVRGDHVGRLAEHAAFTERLGGALVLVPPPTDPELREVIVGPAASVGLSVEPELVDAVVADVVGQAGALPLLSTALVGTWERRRGDLLTLAGYLEAGAVAGALTRSAEAAYAALDSESQQVARQLLVRLADTDEGGALVRRPVPIAELDLGGAGGSQRRAVVETFVGRRLLAVDGDRLEVAHEALLTAWPRLARWLEDDAVGRTVRRHLAPAALEWDRGGRPDDEMYRGARLGAALDWAATPGADVTPVERDFLDASRLRAEADLRDARERVRRTRRLAAGLAGVLAIALLATGLAVRYQRDADARAGEAAAASTVADANRLAALSTTVGSLDVSLLLAAQAVRLAQTPETEDGLLAALVEHRRAVRAVPFTGRNRWAGLGGNGQALFITVGDRVVGWSIGPTSLPHEIIDSVDSLGWKGWRAAAASPTESLLATAGSDGQPWIDVRTVDGSPRLRLDGDVVGGTPVDVGFSADGRRLRVLVTTSDGEDSAQTWRWLLREVDMRSGAVSSTGVGGTFPNADEPLEATFSADGKTAALWSREAGGTATVMSLENGRQVRVRVDRRPSSSLDFLALDNGVAQLWADGAVTLYDRAGRSIQVLDRHRAPVRDVAVAPDGTWAVTAGDGGLVVLWDIDRSTRRWTQRESLTGHEGDVVTADLDPAGRLLVTVSRLGNVIVSNMTPDGGFGSSYPGLSDRWIANRPQVVDPGRLIVAPTRAVSRSGGDPRDPAPDTLSVAATFLDPLTGRVVDHVVVGDTALGLLFGSSVAVNPDRRKVAVTSGLATTVLDTRTRAVLGRVVLPPVEDPGSDDQPGGPELVWGSVWTPDGSRLLLGAAGPLGGTGGDLVVVDPSSWGVERRIDVGGSPQVMEFSPDGRLLAIASATAPELTVVDAATLEVERTVSLGEDYAYDLSFSPDGRRLALGGDFGLLHVLDTATWQPAQEPAKVHDERLLQVEWMPDGRTVVTSGTDGRVSLYDSTRGLVRARPLPASSEVGEGYTHLVPGAADEIVALSGERPGRRYPMEPSHWLAEACAVAGRDLTRAEWSRYVPNRPYEPTCSDLS